MIFSVRPRFYKVISCLLTVQTLCLCCVCSACSPSVAPADHTAADSAVIQPETAADAEETYDRSDWLRDMMFRLGLTQAGELSCGDDTAIFRAAYEKGVVDDPAPCPGTALTRAFAADTVVRALDLSARRVSGVADLSGADTAMMTAAYYGFFIPDDSGRVYPDAVVTDDESTALLTELGRFRRFRGKRLLSFGDSIMYGLGNSGEGLADMIGQKYGMTVSDYSVSGAVFGVYRGRSHIPDQIASAAWYGEQPDLILINGAANDMRVLGLGQISDDYDPASFNTSLYAGGMEYAFWLLRLYWPGVPVLYIRAHDMDCCDDQTERLFGSCALQIAEKWSVPCVNIFDGTDFNAADPTLRDRYTQYHPKKKHGDSVHPNAMGYARYYLPLTAQSIDKVLY